MTVYASRRLRSLSLCAMVTLALVGCTGSSPEAKMAAHLERAENYFNNNQYQEAIIEYKNALQINDKHADAYYRLALAYLKLGGLTNLQAAYAVLNRTVELDGANYDAQLKLGELHLLGNDPAKARERAEIVLVSAPKNTDGLVLKGRSLMNEKHFAEAIAEFKKVIEIDPKNMRAYIELSRAYLFSKNQAEAETILKQALSVDPRSTEIVLTMGDLHATTGKLDQAEVWYKRALETDPQNDQVYVHMVAFYQRAGKVAEVESTLTKLAGLKPEDEKPHILLGDFFTSLGQKDKALASYERATKVKPDSTMARDKLIGHYLDTGNTVEAETRVKDILAKNAKDLMGRFFDARLLLGKHKPDDAIPILQGVIKDEPKLAGAHHFLGAAYMQKRQPAQARAAFADAVKYNPRLSESRIALAQIYLMENSADLALEQAQAAIQLNPRNMQAALLAGNAYLKKGDLAKGRQVFEGMSKVLPNEPVGPYQLGLISRLEKNEAKALAFFEEALKRRPAAIEPIMQIATIKASQGKSEEARRRVVRQIELAPQSPFLHNLLGQLWAGEKNYGQAEQEYKKAIEMDSSLSQAYLNLAGTYLRMGKQDQAVREYEAVLAKNPNSIQAHMVLGMIHESQKELDKAHTHYEAILKLNPRFAPAANNLAWIISEQGGNLDVALGYAQTAREVNQEDPHTADTLGWIYYKKNAHLLAVNLLKEAVEKLPDRAEVHYHYGMAQAKNNNADEAKKALHTALKLNAKFDGADEARKTLEGLK